MSGTCNTTGVVTFSYADWSALYPALAALVSSTTAQLYFNQATLYLNNTPCSPVCDLVARESLLNMLTAHIAQLAQRDASVVGRISNASEGSVSTAFDMGAQPNTAAWYNQTSYGAAYYAAVRPYFQGGRYNPGPQPYLGTGPWVRGNTYLA
jgi:hypothetical protein